MKGEYRRLDAENEVLRGELLELRFPKSEPGEASQVYEASGTHTLEWLPPTEH